MQRYIFFLLRNGMSLGSAEVAFDRKSDAIKGDTDYTGWPVKRDRISWYLVKSDFSSACFCTHVQWTSRWQGTWKTRPCLTSHPVTYLFYSINHSAL